jgi:hypothetical protein
VLVTFRTLPGAPREFLELSDWKLGANVPLADFTFTAPPGSFQAEMMPKPPAPKGMP